MTTHSVEQIFIVYSSIAIPFAVDFSILVERLEGINHNVVVIST